MVAMKGLACLLGAVALYGVQAAPSTVTSVSSASCKVTANSSSESESVHVAAEAAAEATAYVCDSANSAEANVHVLAEATARAAATAIAEASAECYLSGTTSVIINGKSAAQAEAYAYAEAYATAFASASVCNKCTAAATFVAESWEEVFLKAVAEAEIYLEESTSGETLHVAITDFVESVAEATITAYAEVLASAKAGVEDDCNASLFGVLITGDVDDPNSVVCDVVVRGTDESYAYDAVAIAIGHASAYACEGESSASVHLVAESVAEAVAKVIAEVLLSCQVDGEGYACALGDADITAIITATATAFAEGYAEAANACQCHIAILGVAEAIDTILAKATAEAYGDACAGSNSSFSLELVAEAIARNAVTAIAEVIVEATAGKDGCAASLDVTAAICPECADNWTQCWGLEHSPGCCKSADFSCIQRDDGYGQCRKTEHVVPAWWDGTVHTHC